jgi:myosin heavy subunit
LTKVTTKTALKKVTRAALDANTADLSLLDDLKHPLILFKLQQRFAQKIIYTDIGSVVVSVNPGYVA